MKNQLLIFLTGSALGALVALVVVSSAKEEGDIEKVVEFMNGLSDSDIEDASGKFEELIQQSLYVQVSGYHSRAALAFEILRYRDNDGELLTSCAWTFAQFLKVSEAALKDEELRTLREMIKEERARIFQAMNDEPNLQVLVEKYLDEPGV